MGFIVMKTLLLHFGDFTIFDNCPARNIYHSHLSLCIMCRQSIEGSYGTNIPGIDGPNKGPALTEPMKHEWYTLAGISDRLSSENDEFCVSMEGTQLRFVDRGAFT
jgi:hypothetical protein